MRGLLFAARGSQSKTQDRVTNGYQVAQGFGGLEGRYGACPDCLLDLGKVAF